MRTLGRSIGGALPPGYRFFVIGLVSVGANLVLAPPASAATVASYGMDETSGTTMTGVGGPNGTISGDVRLGIAGVTAGGYEFNTKVGSCDASGRITGTGHVVIPSSSVFSPGTNAFSFSVWVKTTAVPRKGDCDFDVVRNGNYYKLELFPFSTNKALPLCKWIGSAGGATLKPQVQVNDGSWHQITCQRAANGESVILDGKTIASTPTNVGSIGSSGKVFVASKPSNADFYVGQLDDLSFTVG